MEVIVSVLEYHVHDAVLLLAAWQVNAKHSNFSPQFRIGQLFRKEVDGRPVSSRRDVTVQKYICGRGFSAPKARSSDNKLGEAFIPLTLYQTVDKACALLLLEDGSGEMRASSKNQTNQDKYEISGVFVRTRVAPGTGIWFFSKKTTVALFVLQKRSHTFFPLVFPQKVGVGLMGSSIPPPILSPSELPFAFYWNSARFASRSSYA